MRIDCTECAMYQSEHCDDCLVTALLHPPNGAVEIDDVMEPPLVALSGAGLLPVLKFQSRPPDRPGVPISGPGGVVDERSA